MKKIYQLGDTLELNKYEINAMLKDKMPEKQVSFSLGPPSYGGGWYGTISIKEFKK